MSYSGWAMGNLSDVFSNNTCITVDPGSIFAFNDCNEASPNDGHVPIFSKNTYANPPGVYEFKCGKQSWNLTQAQAVGVDVGSVLVPLPSTDDIIAAGRALLEF
jgi:hypothetical protein